jgi:hypothetical protein
VQKDTRMIDENIIRDAIKAMEDGFEKDKDFFQLLVMFLRYAWKVLLLIQINI